MKYNQHSFSITLSQPWWQTGMCCFKIILLTSHPRPTQASIPLGSVNEYQLRLGRQRQVWFILLPDERGTCR